MTEYRIAEHNRRFYIEIRIGEKEWRDLPPTQHVPRYFDSLADARSWVATIKRGVVYHDAEEAPNLARDERKAEDDTSTKPLEWFMKRIGSTVSIIDGHKNRMKRTIEHRSDAMRAYDSQLMFGFRYCDPH